MCPQRPCYRSLTTNYTWHVLDHPWRCHGTKYRSVHHFLEFCFTRFMMVSAAVFDLLAFLKLMILKLWNLWFFVGVAKQLVHEFGCRFPAHHLMEALGMVYPQYCSLVIVKRILENTLKWSRCTTASKSQHRGIQSQRREAKKTQQQILAVTFTSWAWAMPMMEPHLFRFVHWWLLICSLIMIVNFHQRWFLYYNQLDLGWS
jgi:hypothetical protein